ncbi:MDR family MFS transporter [Nocardia sp. NPDC023988]|uniref:MDR family MFS transporter n=1 Tax=unclassified Nocardia TaxID=2637762 RepID=UPI0033C1EF0F
MSVWGAGENFAGYELERVLGRGGMGTVFLARHPRLPRMVALKVLNEEMFGDHEIRQRFEREADLIAQLDHPNIVVVHDRGVEDKRLWIAMQYVQGSDAGSLDPVDPTRAARIITDVASALDYAHNRGVLHRDIKPANILIHDAEPGRPERVLLADFGIARLRDQVNGLTQTGTFTATLAYASPEQLAGGELDARCDQYSLACTLFVLLTGTVPFAATNPVAVIGAHMSEPPPSVSARRPGLPVQLDAVLQRAMAKRPQDRFASCSEFAHAVQWALASHADVGAPRSAAVANPAAQQTLTPAMLARAGTAVIDARTPHVPPSTRPTETQPTAGRLWPALFAMAFGFSLIALYYSASGHVVDDYGYSDLEISDSSWIDGAFVSGFLAPLLIAGRLGDRFGPRAVYLFGIVVFAAATALCGASVDGAMFIVARGVQGLGAALMAPQAIVVITRTVPPDRRGRAISLWGVMTGGTLLFVGIAAAYISEECAWRAQFYAGVPLCVVALVLALRLVPSLSASVRNFDLLGSVLSCIGVFSMVWGGQRLRGAESASDVLAWVLIAAGLVVLAGFILSQVRSGSDALIPLRIFRRRNVALSTLGIVLVSTASSALAVIVTVYLRFDAEVREYAPYSPDASDPTDSIVASLQTTSSYWDSMVMVLIVAGLAASMMGTLADRGSPWVLPSIGFLLFSAAAFSLYLIVSNSPSELWTLGVLAAGALAGAAVGTSLTAEASRSLREEQAGAGAGIYSLSIQIGIVLGGVVTSSILADRFGSSDWEENYRDYAFYLPGFPGHQSGAYLAFRDSLWFLAVILVVGALAAASLRSKKSQRLD